MAVPEIFHTVEQTGVSTWIRQSNSVFGFYFILLFHTFGLSTLVGANTVIDLRILGVGSALPLKPFKRLFRIMWIGLGVTVTTGILLLTGYPTEALTNPVFYVKLTFIGFSLITLRRIYVGVFDDDSLSEMAMVSKGKILAKWSLFFWFGSIMSGRLLSETARYLTFGHPFVG